MEYILYAVTGAALLVSLFVNQKKTLTALKISLKRFVRILPAFVLMLVLVSVVLFLVPDRTITRFLVQKSRYGALFIASLFGSITFMPGFITFPLCGLLRTKGVPYMVLSAFTTTLMMVGVLTFPIEKAYFGARVAVLRNSISFFIALFIAIVTGIFFGEVLWDEARRGGNARGWPGNPLW